MADNERSEKVWAITERIAPNVASGITWMDDELTHRLLQTFEATRAVMIIHMVRAGMLTHEQAQDVTPEQLFLMAFHLGFEVGVEFEKIEGFNQMMGGS